VENEPPSFIVKPLKHNKLKEKSEKPLKTMNEWEKKMCNFLLLRRGGTNWKAF
jgi:hypothetical protein